MRRMAPGLCASLTRLSPPLDPRYAQAFAHSCRSGGLNEGAIKRTPGASFNPRPARICQILLSESDERDSDVLCAAILIASHAQAPFASELERAAAFLAEARKFPYQESEVSAEAERVALACHLDTLRHAHMCELSEEERARLRRETEQNYLARSLHRENSRLRTLIEACLKRSFGGSSQQ